MSLHKDLAVWKQAIVLAKEVYALTATFPPSEIYGLVLQMRRAVVSIASNIAEGAARNSDKDFIHFLHIALGSLSELETPYIISKELAFTPGSASCEHTLDEVGKMLTGILKHLKTKPS